MSEGFDEDLVNARAKRAYIKGRRLAAEEMRERAISAVQEYLDACRDAHSHINYVEAAQQILALLSAMPTEE